MRGPVAKNSGNRQQVWVYIVALLFCGDFALYGYMPSHRRLQTLKEARVQQARMIQTAATQSKELPVLKLRLRTVENIAEHYEAYVPEEASLGTFLQEIARIMTGHHLTDQVVVPGKEVEADGINCVPVHVNCKGSLKDIFSFFGDFQAMSRLVRIETVVLKNDTEFTGQVSMEVDAVVFYQPQGQTANDPAGGPSRRGVNHGA